MKKIIVFFVLILLNSCGKEFNKEEIITKYDQTDFSALKNTNVIDRYGVYMINKGNLPFYAVDYNHTKNKIIKIRKVNEFKNYLSEKEINRMINEFNKFEFNGIYVDENLNVHFYIMAGNCTHNFLRRVANTKLESKLYSDYKKLNDKWFYDVRCSETR